MSIDKIDHDALAKERVVSQYKTSKNFNSYISVFMKQSNEIESSLFDLLDKRHLEVAEGAQLDVIGRIVGINRFLVDADDLRFFTMDDLSSPLPDPSRGFGDVNNPEIGGPFRDIGQRETGNVRLSDDQYRLFIKAKILANNTKSTVSDLTKSYRILLDTELLFITESPGKITINVGRPLSNNERLFFTLKDRLGRWVIPRTLGVRISIIEGEAPLFTFDGGRPGISAGLDEGKFSRSSL